MNYDKEKALREYLPPIKYVLSDLKNNHKIMTLYQITIKSVQASGRYTDKTKFKRKREAIKNEFVDTYLNNIIKRIQIIINIKNQIIIDFNKNNKKLKPVKDIIYNKLLDELDSLLDKSVCLINCRKKNFGFCFCKDKLNKYIY
jgi:hypothetical protein